eukprot:TRINITY_DN80521_c0_g1_i1.p1 TRINITY_DN80521_c0_g1~~TRINITY_DN80521_c0_g1_i1.p1  ORF type:complete len:177 (-),score=45.50 TRINITY_DN80521_c0_g1_i1:164-694(-)
MELLPPRMTYRAMDVERVGNPRSLSTSDLITYIVRKHHVFGRTAVEKIRGLISKMDRTLPQFAEFEEMSEDLFTVVLNHFEEEEVRVFPLVFQALEQGGEGSPSPKHRMMIMKVEKDHIDAGKKMNLLIETSKSLGRPAQSIHEAILELAEDLKEHMELEQMELHRRVRMIYQLSP